MTGGSGNIGAGRKSRGPKHPTGDAAGAVVARPARTCIGCRRVSPTAELVRLVVERGRLFAGPRGGRAGRGASIHPRATCVAAALKTHALARAFAKKAPLDVDEGTRLLRDLEVACEPQQREMGRTP